MLQIHPEKQEEVVEELLQLDQIQRHYKVVMVDQVHQ
jgi:hypothetical protein